MIFFLIQSVFPQKKQNIIHLWIFSPPQSRRSQKKFIIWGVNLGNFKTFNSKIDTKVPHQDLQVTFFLAAWGFFFAQLKLFDIFSELNAFNFVMFAMLLLFFDFLYLPGCRTGVCLIIIWVILGGLLFGGFLPAFPNGRQEETFHTFRSETPTVIFLVHLCSPVSRRLCSCPLTGRTRAAQRRWYRLKCNCRTLGKCVTGQDLMKFNNRLTF